MTTLIRADRLIDGTGAPPLHDAVLAVEQGKIVGACQGGPPEGFVTANTGNDAANAPMLAVNAWLGYHVSSAAWTAEKTL